MSWLSGLWSLIRLVLELLGLVRQAQDAADAKAKAEAEKRSQERKEASEDLNNAQTEEEFNEASDRLHRNGSKP